MLPAYLKNLRWSNALFHDDIRIEGVVQTQEGPAVVISQPFIKGRSPTQNEVAQWFDQQGYVPAGVNQWKHPGTGAWIADAHERNFVMTDDHSLVPIDLQVLNPGKDILAREQRER